jgi:hypothetical protein
MIAEVTVQAVRPHLVDDDEQDVPAISQMRPPDFPTDRRIFTHLQNDQE